MTGVEIRQEYLKVRAILGISLKQKYNLIESYNDNERLTLDSSNYSIHFIFFIPEMPEIYICKKGKETGYGNSFMHYLFEKYPKLDEAKKELKELFSPLSDIKDSERYSKETFIKEFQIKITFLQENLSDFLRINIL